MYIFLLFRNKKNEACSGVLALTTMQLDWNIKFDDSESFKEMLNAVVAEEQLNIEYMCFLNNASNSLLGIEDGSGSFNEYISSQRQRYYEVRCLKFDN